MKLLHSLFKSSSELTNWVNDNIEIGQIISITYDRDWYILFYKDFIK